jgi:hypothetical protein
MNQGTRWVLLKQKNRHRKSHAWAPLSLRHVTSSFRSSKYSFRLKTLYSAPSQDGGKGFHGARLGALDWVRKWAYRWAELGRGFAARTNILLHDLHFSKLAASMGGGGFSLGGGSWGVCLTCALAAL